IEQQLPETAGHPLTFSQLKLLRLVAVADVYTVSDAAAFLGVSTAAASRAVDKMVHMGLLRRAQAAEDRRAIHLSLTESGCQLLARFQAANYRALERAFADMPLDGLRRTAARLDRLTVGVVQLLDDSEDLCLRCGICDREECLLQQLTGRSCTYHRARTGVGPLRHRRKEPAP
ncbi:MAG: MarR family transcriptional regulator, partial [Planctomycetota bacterium]